MRLRFALLIVAAGAACAKQPASLPFYRSAAMTPEWLSPAQSSAASMHRVSAFRTIDQTGAVVTDAMLHDRITIAHFFFTGCGDVCPITTRHLQRLLADLPRESRIQVMSYSVTPEHDSVAVLRRWASSHGVADPRWHLLTGDRDSIQRLARESYFVRLGDGATYGVSTIAHTESVVLVDGQGRLRGVYAATLPLEMQRLKEDITVLMQN